MRDEFDKSRFASTRAYRRYLDKVLHQAMNGERPMEDVARAAQACKAGAELFMAEKMLARAGEDIEPERAGGDTDGGLKVPRDVKLFKRKKVRVKTGINKNGERIDDKVVELEGAASDKTLEDDAEAETLV